MKPADIVLTTIPQDNQQKVRPVLILKILPKYDDYLVCAVSSQLHQMVPDFDLLLETTHSSFTNSGLKFSSVFRLGSLAVLSLNDIIGSIGYLEQPLYDTLLHNLAHFLLKK